MKVKTKQKNKVKFTIILNEKEIDSLKSCEYKKNEFGFYIENVDRERKEACGKVWDSIYMAIIDEIENEKRI